MPTSRWLCLLISLLGISCFADLGNPGFLASLKPAASGGGGGDGTFTQVASDDFSTQVGFTDLDDDTDWEKEQGTITVVGAGELVSNAAGDSLYRWVSGSFSADQYATCTISVVGVFDSMGCAVRVQNEATGYGVYYNESSTTLDLFYISAGTKTSIQTTTKNYADGVQLRLRAQGAGAAARLSVWEDTGSGWVAVWTDENPAVDIDGGRPGLVTNNANNTPRITAWTSGDWTP